MREVIHLQIQNKKKVNIERARHLELLYVKIK